MAGNPRPIWTWGRGLFAVSSVLAWFILILDKQSKSQNQAIFANIALGLYPFWLFVFVGFVIIEAPRSPREFFRTTIYHAACTVILALAVGYTWRPLDLFDVWVVNAAIFLSVGLWDICSPSEPIVSEDTQPMLPYPVPGPRHSRFSTDNASTNNSVATQDTVETT